MLQGLMMDRQLSIAGVLEHAARTHPGSEIVSARVEGDRHRLTFLEFHRRTHQLAHALVRLGVKPGDRVATLAWNGYRHLELYYAAAGIGAVCHTINPRLFPEQIAWIVNHAEDGSLFFDTNLTPLISGLLPHLPASLQLVALCEPDAVPTDAPSGTLSYESLLAAESGSGPYAWPDLPETTACGLCYTSGTTGHPKGVLYSHRSQILHAFSTILALPSTFAADKRVLPVVPLFHVNAWGLPYIALLTGTTLVMPGPRLDGPSVFDLMEDEKVTASFGVPTVWNGLIEEMRKRGTKPSALHTILVGGSALTETLLKAGRDEFGLNVCQGWGMTETSPIGTLPLPRKEADEAKDTERLLRQGGALYTVDLRIEDEEGHAQPHDGVTRGELMIRSPFVASAYFNDPEASSRAFTPDGWFHTGDVAVIHPDGEMQIVDRTKDLIKSGGEWISSIELEAEAMKCPGVATAAAIAVQHPKWAERPLLCVVKKAGAEVSAEAIRGHIATHMAKWQVPEDVVFIEALPMTATGKISKLQLRERFRDFYKEE